MTWQALLLLLDLMKNLALRKAKINAVGVVGLVENMVSGVLKDLEIL